MAAQTPPYVLQAGSHSAELFRRTQQLLLSADGIVSPADLAVSAGGGMSVNVAPGQAVISGTLGSTTGMPAGTSFTSQGSYAGYNDAVVNLAIAASNPTNARIDLVVATVQDSYYSGAANQWVLMVVTGTPAVTPVPPAAPASSNILAQVAVPAGATSIVAGNITDQRTPMATYDGPALAANAAAFAKLPGRVEVGYSLVTTSSGGLATITFPTAFASILAVIATQYQSGGHAVSTNAQSTTGFTAFVWNGANVALASTAVYVMWIAIGT